jgi:hypothetical protein
LGEVGTQGFKLVTKLPSIPENCADVSDWVQKQIDESFARLGVSSVYGLLLHRSEQLLGQNGKLLYQALQALKDSGNVQKIGVSIYAPSELDALTSQYSFDLVQAPFNLVDRRLLTTGWMQRLKDEEVEIHTRSAFLQGLLLMPKTTIQPKFSPWSDLWKKWHYWLIDNDVDAVQACLAYPLSFLEIDRVVVGADKVSQLDQIIHFSNLPISNNLPDIHSEDEHLINPANWSKL